MKQQAYQDDRCSTRVHSIDQALFSSTKISYQFWSEDEQVENNGDYEICHTTQTENVESYFLSARPVQRQKLSEDDSQISHGGLDRVRKAPQHIFKGNSIRIVSKSCVTNVWNKLVAAQENNKYMCLYHVQMKYIWIIQ